MQPVLQETISNLYRQLYSKMVSSLTSYFGLSNLALAEDIVQETFITAYEKWEADLPDDPTAWLFKVCKNKTLNHLAKKTNLTYSTFEITEEASPDHRLTQLFLDHEIKDNQLRLLFACCHPKLSSKAQIILILKILCGLRIEEIARGLIMSDEAVAKTLTRSKEMLRKENVPLRVPFLMRSHQRLNNVHTAIYLLFNEGYTATEGNIIIKHELCMEAMRLMKSIIDIEEICTADSYALMALMCFHTARFNARINELGEIIDLENQDRNIWDRDLITLGFSYVKRINNKNSITRFVLEAAIASSHCLAPSFAQTNWTVIANLYSQLKQVHPSPLVDLNLAIVIFYKGNTQEAIKILTQSSHLSTLKDHYLYHTFLAITYSYEGNISEAVNSYKKALSLTKLKAEQDYIKKKLALLNC